MVAHGDQNNTHHDLPHQGRTRAPSPHSPARTTVSRSGSEAPPLSHFYTEEDFEDMITTWGKYSTPELVKSSPFYTCTEIETDHHARRVFPGKQDVLTRTIHAVHPIPRAYLRELGPNCLHDLGEQLEEERWELSRDLEFTARVMETLGRIDDALEYVFRVELPGSRLFSSRNPWTMD